MAKSLPPLSWFRAFESAARHLSFTAAADELGVTQSAVSQHVKSLEARFDTILFYRKARGLSLTDEGRRLLPEISTAISHIANVANSFDTPTAAKLLTIATSVSFAQWFLVPKLDEYLRMHPDCSIRIISTVWPDDFVSTTADIEIRFGAQKQVGKNAKRIEPDRLILVASPQLMENGNPKMSWDEIRQYPFIQTVGTSNTWKYWSEKMNLNPEVKSSIFVDSYGMAIDFARQGTGIAMTSSLIARPSLSSGHLVQVGDKSVRSIDGYFLATNPKGNETQIENFVSWLETYMLPT